MSSVMPTVRYDQALDIEIWLLCLPNQSLYSNCMINTLEPLNVILANLYIVMLLQLVFNWSAADCNTYSNFYQLVFILTMFTRVIIQ